MPKKNAPKTLAARPPVDDDGVLVLQGELFWKWRALDADIRRTKIEADAKQAAIDAEIAKLPELKRLIDERHGLVREHAQHSLEMRSVHAEMEKLLGVEVKNISVDDKTGRVHVLAADGTPSPAKPAKPRAKLSKK